jgi:hypothetical protein
MQSTTTDQERAALSRVHAALLPIIKLSTPASPISMPTGPFPLVDIGRAAHAPRNRANVDVAIEDVPAVFAFGISAAGEGGHGLLKRQPCIMGSR